MDPEPRPLPREIRTDRLVLRAVHPDDAPDQAPAVNAALPELSAWMPWARGPQSVEDARANLADAAAQWEAGTLHDWVIRDADGAFVGRLGLHNLDWHVPKAELGYWLSTPYVGRGYVQEAVRAVVAEALAVGMRRVEIRCDALNRRSAAVAEAAGFTLDACLRHDAVAADDPTRLRDTLIYSLVR